MPSIRIPFAKQLITACLAATGLQSASAGDLWYLGETTIDKQTGYQWLALSETVGLSYNEVTAQMGAGGQFEGYRYASQREVLSFMQRAGVVAKGTRVQEGSFATLGWEAAADFQFNFRYTAYDNMSNPPYSVYISRGFTVLDTESFSNPGVVSLTGFFHPDMALIAPHYEGLLQLDGGFAPDVGNSMVSSWLLNDITAPVPEPATRASLVLGLSLLGAGMWLQRRRQSGGTAA